MGDFNKTGFFSHLPITYGDEIVMFVCANTKCGERGSEIDSTPINVTGIGLTPIAMPFFGIYNDYGSIENVVDDANHKYFTKKVGMTLEEFADYMHEYSGKTIASLTETIKGIKSGDEEYKYTYKKVEDLEKAVEIIKKAFGFKPERFLPDRYKDNEEIKKTFERMHQYELKKYNNTSIILTMEHKSIYDKMVEVGKAGYTDGWSWYEPVTPDEAFDFTVKIINEHKEEIGSVNPLQFGPQGFVSIKLGIDDNDRKGLYKFFASHCILHDTVHIDDFDHCFYNGCGADIEPMKELAVNYVYFLKSFERTNTVFNFSPYHSQTVDYDTLIPIFEEVLATLKRKAEKYHSYDDEE